MTSETGERNVSSGHRSSVELLTDDGALSEPLFLALAHIFSKYLDPRPTELVPTPQGLLYPPPLPTASLSPAGLDAFARETNGAEFDQSTKEEISTFFDVHPQTGGLTIKGFEEMYTLQTENDEEETWKDLAAHGFDRSLQLVSSRREDEN